VRDRNGSEVLTRAECLELLGGTGLGRIGFSDRDEPTVLPVTYTVVGDEIVVSTAPGRLCDELSSGRIVACEVDHVDGLYRTGWSVLVRARARSCEDPAVAARVAAGPLARWTPRRGDRLVALDTTDVTGRRVCAAGDEAHHERRSIR
jgi:nitroimidazol reductase NimA-like FMN-containing flavoprotein (pyridoxamine 5'-phosphate oxidase superfamily)